MQSVSDQLDKIIAWVILTLVSAVTILVGWIFREQLERIAGKFSQMENIFNERQKQAEILFSERLKQIEQIFIYRLDQQDKALKSIKRDVGTIHGEFTRIYDVLDGAQGAGGRRVLPRGTAQDRDQEQDPERHSSDEF